MLPYFCGCFAAIHRPAGPQSIERWFARLDDSIQARITVALDRLERGSSSMKGVGAGVFEMRLDFGPGHRIYFGKDGETLILLLCGGTKRRQQDDIGVARHLWREYKVRKQER